MEAKIRNGLENLGVRIFTRSRVRDIVRTNNRVEAVVTDKGDEISGDILLRPLDPQVHSVTA